MFVVRPSIIDLFPRFFGFSSVYLDIILLLLYMMTSNMDDNARFVSNRSSPTSAHGLVPHLPPDDPTSASYIPREARMIPTSTTVHSVFIKKLSYPLSTRPDELWIVERTLDGIETWKPVETFWRTCTSPTIVLPYVPRPTSGADTMTYRSNHPPPLRQLLVLFYHTRNTPTSTSPNRTKRYRTNSIFYSHAGDVPAQHHSQGTTTSLYWPPWRSTPPSSTTGNIATYLTSQSPHHPSLNKYMVHWKRARRT